MRFLLMLPLAAALLGVAAGAHAIDPIEESELNQGIINGCLNQAGEFGIVQVRACIEHETTAAKEVLAYPKELDPIVLRCMQDPLISGWSMVKSCVGRALEVEGAAQKP
jgi:hypothetical protein